MARVARRPRVFYGDFVGMLDEMRCTSSQDVCFPQALDHLRLIGKFKRYKLDWVLCNSGLPSIIHSMPLSFVCQKSNLTDAAVQLYIRRRFF